MSLAEFGGCAVLYALTSDGGVVDPIPVALVLWDRRRAIVVERRVEPLFPPNDRSIEAPPALAVLMCRPQTTGGGSEIALARGIIIRLDYPR